MFWACDEWKHARTNWKPNTVTPPQQKRQFKDVMRATCK